MGLLKARPPEAVHFSAGAVAIGICAEAKRDAQRPPAGGGENENESDGNESNGFHKNDVNELDR